MVRPVAVRHPAIRWGRCWIFLSLRLMRRTRPAWSGAAKLAMDRLSSDQIPETPRRVRRLAFDGTMLFHLT